MLKKFLIFAFIFFPDFVLGKTRHTSLFSSAELSAHANSRVQVKDLEERFRPILEHKSSRTKRSRDISSDLSSKFSSTSKGPEDSDFLLLAKFWNELSPEFKSLYKMAASIPSSFKTIVSPGGHFDISYTVSGIDAVDTTDNYGYSLVNWRIKENQKNGIPDYIDEVGWALDSCWSVQIDKFGLVAPSSFLKGSSSGRYGVIVEAQSPLDYGLTWVGEKASNASKGYSSYISLRNTWSNWQEQGYDKHPESGLRVTCAHEFLHAIQYAMSWNVVSRNGSLCLDNFPLSWIEGSAASMEELLFNDINDYLQYANMYFSYPTAISFLNGSNDVYTNAILFLYLLKRTSNGTDENFITKLHKTNYASIIDFTTNICNAAVSYGYNWTELLNDFHTASFFTGSIADTNRFLSDAPLYNRWSFQENNSSPYGEIKTVRPYAMQKFYLKRSDSDIDTLRVFLRNETENQQTATEKPWAASFIVKHASSDTIFPVQLDSKGNGLFQYVGWKDSDYALAIVSNGDPEKTLPYSVWFEYSSLIYTADSTYTITPIDNSNVKVTLHTNTDLRGNLQITTENDPGKYDTSDSTILIAKAFNIIIPGSWNSDQYKNLFSTSLHIQLPSDSLLVANSGFSSIYYYNTVSKSSEKINTVLTNISDSVVLSAQITKSGLYYIVKPAPDSASNSSQKIVVYPNHIHIQKSTSGSIFISGAEISEIRVYNLEGLLKYSGSPSQNKNTGLKRISQQGTKYIWSFSKQLLCPGLYSIVVMYKDKSEKKKSSLQKIVVVP